MTAPRPSAAVEDAVVAVIAEHGLEGTSVRRVAARAGVSIGAVQHHFPTKDAMLSAAMARVEAVYRRRLADVAAEFADRPDMILRATLRSLVPGSPAERADTSLWLAFVARAAVHDATAAQHRLSWQSAEHGIAGLITACVLSSAGSIGADTAATDNAGVGTAATGDKGTVTTAVDEVAANDPADEPSPWARDAAAELLALADGLAIASTVEPGRMPPARARHLLDAAAVRVLRQAGVPLSR